MAVALNPSKALYSKKTETSENKNNAMSTTSYADSPSRQVRRSARVASLSPSSFTPLISEPLNSGTSSSTSSYMPTSPSSKYSMMRGGYNGVSIDEIVINEIEGENRGHLKQTKSQTSSSSFYPTLESSFNSSSSSSYLRSNPDRKHPTLDFQPTNLSTPSTTLNSVDDNKSGITPAVKQINLQETPGQRILDKLVSKGDMDEIAKATPLGNYYNRKATETVKVAGVGGGVEKSKIQIIQSSKSNSVVNSSSYSNSHTSNSNTYNNSHNSNINTHNNSHQSAYPTLINTSTNMARTPQKQTSDTAVENSDETVKVVRTLRNRSIVASPLPASSALRRNSLAPRENRETKPKIDVTVLFKKHQKNLLAYSLAALFLFATVYHIYDGLISSSVEMEQESPNVTIEIPTAPIVPIAPVTNVNTEEILKLIDTKLTEIKEDENERISNLIEKFAKVDEKLTKVDEIIAERPAAAAANSVVNAVDVELQRKALDSVANSVKNLEKKFQSLEAKIERVQKEQKVKIVEKVIEKVPVASPPPRTVKFIDLKVVKHLSTSPLQSGFFKSSQFPPENAISSELGKAFKFAGNRGKLAVLLPNQMNTNPSHVVIEHPLLPDRSCAPRDIEIWALPNILNERDNPVLISKGTFDLSKATQSFQLNTKLFKEKPIVLQLRIRNNHGNTQFTCLYSIKVQDN